MWILNLYVPLLHQLYVIVIYGTYLVATTAGPVATAGGPSNVVRSSQSSLPPETHIVSFVAQRKTSARYTDLKNFDFENFDKTSNDAAAKEFANKGALEQLFGPLITNPSQPRQRAPIRKSENLIKTDDLNNNVANTLENTNDSFDDKDLMRKTPLHVIPRFKQSIPVLEPVRHLLNTVRDGGFNHTAHFNKSRHQLIRPGETGESGSDGNGSGSSSAIETEEDREIATESTSFRVLDFLGSFGRMMFEFIMNIKRWFLASSGNASAAGSY